jgi:hypothetical protein
MGATALLGAAERFSPLMVRSLALRVGEPHEIAPAAGSVLAHREDFQAAAITAKQILKQIDQADGPVTHGR